MKDMIGDKLFLILLVIPAKDNMQYNWTLLSNCGETDLDSSTERRWSEGKEVAEYCEIKNISSLIEYIKAMESFHMVLKDVDFGGFKKSELFWAIQYRIMHQNLYTNSSEQVYGMRSIYNDGENAFFDISVCGIDQISDIVLEMQRNIPLETAVAKVAEQINGFREMQSDWDEKEIPLFKYSPMIQYYVPKTLQDITDAFMNNQY